MFISKLGFPERRGYHSRPPKRRLKNIIIHGLLYVLDFKSASCVHVSLIPG